MQQFYFHQTDRLMDLRYAEYENNNTETNPANASESIDCSWETPFQSFSDPFTDPFLDPFLDPFQDPLHNVYFGIDTDPSVYFFCEFPSPLSKERSPSPRIV